MTTENGDKVRLEHLELHQKAQDLQLKEMNLKLQQIDINQKVAAGKHDMRERMGKWLERVFFMVLAALAYFKDAIWVK